MGRTRGGPPRPAHSFLVQVAIFGMESSCLLGEINPSFDLLIDAAFGELPFTCLLDL